MAFYEKLSALRKVNNLTQEEFAERLGVSRQSVSKWESGIAMPELERILEISKMFNKSLDELLLDRSTLEQKNQKHFPVCKLLFTLAPIIIICIDYILYRLEGTQYSFDNLEGYLAYLKTQLYVGGVDGIVHVMIVVFCITIYIVRFIMYAWNPAKMILKHYYQEVKKEIYKFK